MVDPLYRVEPLPVGDQPGFVQNLLNQFGAQGYALVELLPVAGVGWKAILSKQGGAGTIPGNPLYVQVVGGPLVTVLISGSTSAVGAGSETTILSVIVPAGDPVFLDAVEASGQWTGKYVLYINGAPTKVQRTSAANRNVHLPFNQHRLNPGDTVELRVTHWAAAAMDFDASLEYHR